MIVDFDAKPLRAFHGKLQIKRQYLQRVEQHRKADQLLQRYGYFRRGRGCAVGCTVHCNQQPHELYPQLLGIPTSLAHLEDFLFENMPAEDSRQWPTCFLRAIPVGADLSQIGAELSLWMLRDSDLLPAGDHKYTTLVRRLVEQYVGRLDGKVDLLQQELLWEDIRSEQEVRRAASRVESPNRMHTENITWHTWGTLEQLARQNCGLVLRGNLVNAVHDLVWLMYFRVLQSHKIRTTRRAADFVRLPEGPARNVAQAALHQATLLIAQRLLELLEGAKKLKAPRKTKATRG